MFSLSLSLPLFLCLYGKAVNKYTRKNKPDLLTAGWKNNGAQNPKESDRKGKRVKFLYWFESGGENSSI